MKKLLVNSKRGGSVKMYGNNFKKIFRAIFQKIPTRNHININKILVIKKFWENFRGKYVEESTEKILEI